MKIVVCLHCSKIRNYDKNKTCKCDGEAFYNWRTVYGSYYYLIKSLFRHLFNK